jgi:hypothetical protein
MQGAAQVGTPAPLRFQIRVRRRPRNRPPFAAGVAGLIESFVESGSEEVAFETGAAEDLVLADSHAFEREKFLRVYRFTTGNQVGFEIGGVIETFEADHCER